MSSTRPSSPGATKTCPHCKCTILGSASVCPACRHHLRFVPTGTRDVTPAFPALRIEAGIVNPQANAYSEYSVVVAMRNERGEEIARHVIHVGALAPGEQRHCVLSVDVFKPDDGSVPPARREH